MNVRRWTAWLTALVCFLIIMLAGYGDPMPWLAAMLVITALGD